MILENNNSPVNIALVGFGLIGQVHAKLIRENSRANIAAVVDPSALAKKAIQAMGVPYFADLKALWRSMRPDAVIVASPNSVHFDHAHDCLQSGVPVLIEKPVTMDVEQASTLLKLQEKVDVPVLVGHHRAHSHAMRHAVAILKTGALGDLVSVMGSAQFFKPPEYFTVGPWRKQAGGGPLLINFIHEIHNLRMLCGEIAKVHAISSSMVRNFEVEDTVAMTLTFANGVLGSFLLSDTVVSPHSWELTSGENPQYPRQINQDCYWLSGTEGTLAVPSMCMHTQKKGYQSWLTEQRLSQEFVSPNDPMKDQLEHFVNVVKGHAKPLVSLKDGAANVAVLEAAKLSIQNECDMDVALPF
jgi:predicted dehydrogenase